MDCLENAGNLRFFLKENPWFPVDVPENQGIFMSRVSQPHDRLGIILKIDDFWLMHQNNGAM
jgi:hypothetical protein